MWAGNGTGLYSQQPLGELGSHVLSTVSWCSVTLRLSWDTNHFSSHDAAPVRKWSAKIPSSDSEQLLRVTRLLSLVDS